MYGRGDLRVSSDTDQSGQPSRPSSDTRGGARRSHWTQVFRIAFVLLALAGLVWLLDRIGWSTIADHFVSLGWDGVAILFLLGNVENLFDAAAFWAALPRRVPLWRVLACNQAGGLLNRFIPWEAGEVLKGTLLSRHIGGRHAVAGTVIWNYVFRMTKPATALAAALVGLVLGSGALDSVAPWLVLAAFLSFIPYVGMRLLVAVGLGRIFVAVLKILRLLRRDPDEAARGARELDETVRRFWRTHPWAYVQVVLYQIGARLTSWVTLSFVLLTIHDGLTVWDCALVWCAFTVLSYLVSVLPTRLGTTEAGGYAVFELLGQEPALGLITQTILSSKAIILAALTGALAAVGGGRRPEEPPASAAAEIAERTDTGSGP